MRSIAIKVDEDFIDLYMIGDMHLGDANCKIDLLLKDIGEIKKNDKARVILMGDLLNCGTKHSVGEGPFSEVNNTQAQYEQAIEIFNPIKDKIILSLVGNHEQRIINETSINPIKNMCSYLDIPYGDYASFIEIKINKQKYKIFACHGTGGSTKLHSKISKIMGLAKTFQSDIILMGHVHELVLTKDTYRTIQGGKIINKNRYYQITGSYLGYDGGYAEMKLLDPGTLGCGKLRLYGTHWDVENLVK